MNFEIHSLEFEQGSIKQHSTPGPGVCPCILSGSLHRGCFSVSLLCHPLPFLSTWSPSAALSPMLSTPLSQPSTAHSPSGHRVLTAAGLRLQSPPPLDFRIEGQLYFAMCCSSHSQASPWDHLQEVTWGHGALFGWDGTTNTPQPVFVGSGRFPSPSLRCSPSAQGRDGVVDPAPRPGCRAALRGCREVLILLVRHSTMALWVLCSLFLQALISLLALCLLSPSVPSTSHFSNTSEHFSASHISLELFLCLAQWVPVVTT